MGMEEHVVCLDGGWKSLSDQITSILDFAQVQRSAIEEGGGVYPEAAEVVIAQEDNFVLNPEQVSIETA